MRIQIPENKKLVVELVIPVRWGDMDAMGHVNNTSYFRYMEILRVAWFREIGTTIHPDSEGLIVINSFCTFHKQFDYPGNVLGRLYVSDPGRSSFETWVTMSRTDDPDTLYASGGATAVWVDFPKQKSAEMPAWLKALLR